MSTPKKKSKSKAKSKKVVKKPQVITDQELGEKLTEALNEMAVETQPVAEEPVAQAEDQKPKVNKLQKMVELLLVPEGVPLKELAEQLGWLENSVRGAMSAYAKKHPEYRLITEKSQGVRTYRLSQS